MRARLDAAEKKEGLSSGLEGRKVEQMKSICDSAICDSARA